MNDIEWKLELINMYLNLKERDPYLTSIFVEYAKNVARMAELDKLIREHGMKMLLATLNEKTEKPH